MRKKRRLRMRTSRARVRCGGVITVNGVVVGVITGINFNFDSAPVAPGDFAPLSSITMDGKFNLFFGPNPQPYTAPTDTRPNHRQCTDEEYNAQRRCWTCAHYSFKGYTDDDHNSGKCFVLDRRPAAPNMQWTEGMQICDLFKQEVPRVD